MDPWEAVKWIAIFRLILPDALFRLCGGRVENLAELQPLAVKAGVNGVMMGNFLTTLGNTPERGPRDVRGPGPQHRPPARQRRQPAAGQPLAAGSTARRPDIVEEFLDDCTPSGERRPDRSGSGIPSSQLRFRAQDKAVPPRPDGAPNAWPAEAPVGPRRPRERADARHRTNASTSSRSSGSTGACA